MRLCQCSLLGFGESACAQKIGDFPVVDNRKSQMSWCVPNKNADKNRLRGYIGLYNQFANLSTGKLLIGLALRSYYV